MGWLSSVGEAVMSGVSKVADAATGGAIGKVISDALGKLGLPPAICNVMAMIGDPSYSTQAICEQIDEVGRALGLPEELTGALKKIVKKADEYAKAFAQGGFGAVVCAIGKDLGLPPVLYEAIAAAIDAYTGNEAAAAGHLMKLAAEAAKLLGVPESALHIAELGADLVTRNSDGIAKDAVTVGLDVMDHFEVPAEFRDGVHLIAHAYTNDKEAVAGDALRLAMDIGKQLDMPPEASAALALAAGFVAKDEKTMQAAGKELAKDLVSRMDLPPLLKAGLTEAASYGIDHPGDVAGRAAEIPAMLDQLPSMIEGLPGKARAGADAAYDFITHLGKNKGDNQDGPGFAAAAGKLLEEAKSHLPSGAKRGLDIAIHVFAGDKAAMDDDLKQLEKEARDPAFVAKLERLLTGHAEVRDGNAAPANDNDHAEVVRQKILAGLRA
jgi:hypothetical protein